MKFGLKDKDYNFIGQNLRRILGEDVVVWCFGSRAKGNQQKFSDLDLMVEKVANSVSKLGELNEIFQESDLPIKIDLIDEDNFAKSYRESYLKERVRFY